MGFMARQSDLLETQTEMFADEPAPAYRPDPEKVRDLLSSGQPVAGLAFLPSGELIR